MRRSAAVAAAMGISVSLALVAGPAQAIVGGQPDDDHPEVGALVAYGHIFGADEPWYWPFCTGTLIAEDVVLTAGHCVDLPESITPPGTEFFMTFAEDVDDDGDVPEESLVPVGEMEIHPDFAVARGTPGAADVALLRLEEQVPITPALLPEQGRLTAADRSTWFTAVGYGISREDPKRKGPLTQFFDGVRRAADQRMIRYNSSWLMLSMNPATGNAGTCNGDSGGPHFLTGTHVVMSVTSWGDRYCRATDWTARVDTPAVLEFIEDFVDE